MFGRSLPLGGQPHQDQQSPWTCAEEQPPLQAQQGCGEDKSGPEEA